MCKFISDFANKVKVPVRLGSNDTECMGHIDPCRECSQRSLS